jgi:tRNA threonylcarbamoyladenosine biosynthesis protein TsaB
LISLDQCSGVCALGIETSLSVASICLFDQGSQKAIISEELSIMKGHAEVLPFLLGRLLPQTKKENLLINQICVSVGPGSFTGTRIGISAAKALAAVLNVPVYGTSTTTAFAAPYFGAGLPVMSVIDAGNGRVYFEYFNASGQQVLNLTIAEIAEAARVLPPEQIIVTGLATELFLREASARGVQICSEGRRDSPGAEEIVKTIVLKKAQPLPPEPLYLVNQYRGSSEGLS